MALLYSKSIPFGSPAPDFSLPGIDGKTYSLASFAGAKALVIVFMCNHCPYVQVCWDRLIALQEGFGQLGVQFVGINSNDDAEYPEDRFEKMKEYAKERVMNFPYLRDASQTVAKAYGAVCTPDIFVYQAEPQQGYPSNKQVLLRLAYHGRIDDNWKDPTMVKRRELAEALEALLEGKKPPKEQQPSMGCSIKWK